MRVVSSGARCAVYSSGRAGSTARATSDHAGGAVAPFWRCSGGGFHARQGPFGWWHGTESARAVALGAFGHGTGLAWRLHATTGHADAARVGHRGTPVVGAAF